MSSPLVSNLLLSLAILFASISSSHAQNFQNLTLQIPIISTGPVSSRLHLVPVQLGEPPQTLFLIPDTGSDATWVLCDPVHNGFFDQSSSSTYAPAPYNTTHHCTFCGPYTLDYMDGTSTSGHWARETVTVGSPGGPNVKIRDVVIGCSDQESTDSMDADGILGLASVRPSFVSHVASRFGMTFGYSMSGDRGELIFGASVDRADFQYTELVHGDPMFYNVEIAGLWIGDERLDVPDTVWKYDSRNGSGGVVLDTGTTLTYVPEIALEAIHGFYVDFFRSYNVRGSEFGDLCFDSWAIDWGSTHLPRMSIRFRGGARLNLDNESLFYNEEVSIRCLAIRSIDGGEGTIIGSKLQEGYYWEYDLLNQTVGFAPMGSV